MAAQTALKIDLLGEAGYAYAFDRQLYVNRKTKKAFSVEFIEEHSEEQLRKFIGEAGEGTKWRFYFNSPPSESVKRELESVLG